MSALAPIIIADSIPANRTFAPVGIDVAGVAKLTDRTSGIAIGFPVLTLSVRSPNKGSRNYKVMGKLVIPTLEATSPSTATGIQPAPTKAYDSIGMFEFVIPERSTPLERANLLALVRSALLNANVSNAVQTFETIY